ncbi:MAG: DUF2726 domain-containing protein [Gammaproteobacteria bacterium]|nr:MAG: DUF2726 domain-containing protein [Gammaproteobacteria bacterium]
MINAQAIFAESLTNSVNALLNQPLIPYLVIGSVILAFLVFILKLTLISLGRLVDFKYKSLGTLFSDAEQCFFHVLKQSLSDQYEIFAKVRIADILTPDHALSRRNWQSAFFKISSKHFDYVLCDKETLAVVAVIELDDRSHELSKSRSRDIFVQEACRTAGLKLLRFPCRKNYRIQAVREKVINSLNSPA